jgi:hypothetical protein
MMPLRVAAAPVPVMPRAAKYRIIAEADAPFDPGSLRSYFTIDVYGGLMRLPTVLYSLITYCSVCGTSSG